MRDFYNLENYHYGKSSKKAYNRGKSFGYQVLGFGSGGGAAGYAPTQLGIIAYGTPGPMSTSNVINSSGVVGSDVSGVGTAKQVVVAATYGYDKAIMGWGDGGVSTTNLVSNTGVVAADTAGVGTTRTAVGASFGLEGNAIFAFGYGGGPPSMLNLSNLVSNLGVIASDTAGVGTARADLAGVSYDTDKAVVAFGRTPASSNLSNLINDVGVVASDTAGVGTARGGVAAAPYGEGLGVMAYGTGVAPVGKYNTSNLVNISGVIATDTSGVGTARSHLGACGYGGETVGIFAYGNIPDPAGSYTNVSNLVNSSGVIATDTAGVGVIRYGCGAAGIGN
jgi:hypothetical protein|tara:strand:+ start:80 stop:1087 length:1008 start_codon:yes stop_codon:yes gene_type:complete